MEELLCLFKRAQEKGGIEIRGSLDVALQQP
jgi:hypothetical protein